MKKDFLLSIIYIIVLLLLLALPAISLAAPGQPANPSIPSGTVNITHRPVFDWHDSANTTSYDLYLWMNGSVKPSVPFAADLTSSLFILEEILEPGTTYRWQVIAKDGVDETAGPEWTFDTLAAYLPGDVDVNGLVTLHDAIFVMKLLANITPAKTLYKEADVSGDSKLGFEEAQYVLQVIAGIRAGLMLPQYTNEYGMTFNLIPAGTFMMGSPASEPGREDIETLHQVTLTKSFYMMTTEVTQGHGLVIMGSNPAYFSDCGPDCPVENVNRFDVDAFIDTINTSTGLSYRLPTEAEWEYAARAGSTSAFTNGTITQMGCALDPTLDAVGWYCGNSAVTYNGCEDLSASGGPICAGPHPVAQKQPNAWGLYDMHGNVVEWVNDFYDGGYQPDPVTDPTGPVSGTTKVCRGGMYSWEAEFARSAQRFAALPSTRLRNLGFRVLLPVN